VPRPAIQAPDKARQVLLCGVATAGRLTKPGDTSCRIGDVASVVTTAMRTSVVNNVGVSTPRSRPTFNTISSIKPRRDPTSARKPLPCVPGSQPVSPHLSARSSVMVWLASGRYCQRLSVLPTDLDSLAPAGCASARPRLGDRSLRRRAGADYGAAPLRPPRCDGSRSAICGARQAFLELSVTIIIRKYDFDFLRELDVRMQVLRKTRPDALRRTSRIALPGPPGGPKICI